MRNSNASVTNAWVTCQSISTGDGPTNPQCYSAAQISVGSKTMHHHSKTRTLPAMTEPTCDASSLQPHHSIDAVEQRRSLPLLGTALTRQTLRDPSILDNPRHVARREDSVTQAGTPPEDQRYMADTNPQNPACGALPVYQFIL